MTCASIISSQTLPFSLFSSIENSPFPHLNIPPSCEAIESPLDTTQKVNLIFLILREKHPELFLKVLELMPKGGILQMTWKQLAKPQFLISLAVQQNLFFDTHYLRFTKEKKDEYISAEEIQKYYHNKLKSGDHAPVNDLLERICDKIFCRFNPNSQIILNLVEQVTIAKVIELIKKMYEKDNIQYFELSIPVSWVPFLESEGILNNESTQIPKVRFLIELTSSCSLYQFGANLNSAINYIHLYPNKIFATNFHEPRYSISSSYNHNQMKALSDAKAKLIRPQLAINTNNNHESLVKNGPKNRICEILERTNPNRMVHDDTSPKRDQIAAIRQIASKGIAVVVSLVKNREENQDVITSYVDNNIPIILNPSDNFVPSSMTQEFHTASKGEYNFSYFTIKQLIINSISYSFLPGDSILQHPDGLDTLNKLCNGQNISNEMSEIMFSSEKAREEFDLFDQLDQFEKKMIEDYGYLVR